MTREREWIPLVTAARRLRLSFDTALSHVRANVLRGRLVGERWWIRRSELERFRHRYQPGPGGRAA